MLSLRAALISLASLALVAATPAEKRQDAGPHTGRATFYEVGLGVCGLVNPSDFVVALSPGVFDAFPGATPGDPSHNPICERQATVTCAVSLVSYCWNEMLSGRADKNKSITVAIADRCASCDFNDIDLSIGAFEALAGDIDDDLIEVTWEIIGL